MSSEQLSGSAHILCLIAMTTFESLTKLFRDRLATPFDAEPTELLPPANIELEELDHDGRRSIERRRRRHAIRPVIVRSS